MQSQRARLCLLCQGIRLPTLHNPQLCIVGTNLGWADSVFNPVVINLHTAVGQIDLKPGPLAESVGDGFAQQTLGQNRSAQGELIEKLLEAAVDRDTLGGTHGCTQGRTGFVLAQFGLDLIKMGELEQDPADQPGHFGGGLYKLAPDVR